VADTPLVCESGPAATDMASSMAISTLEGQTNHTEMVRRAVHADIPSMQQLINGFAARNRMLFRSATELAEFIDEYFVYVEDSCVQGVCGLHPVAGGLAEVRGLAVSEQLAGRGVGRRLVEACVAHARELGVRKVYTLTLVPGFFEKLRFVQVDKSTLHIKVWYECYRCPKFAHCDEIAMVRPLDLEFAEDDAENDDGNDRR
jgi:amino-acid N-acetyltransferase